MTESSESPQRRTVTLEDVAQRVGVSARTVSRVVNNEGGCTEETRLRILKAIEELGYRPNLMARGLIRRRSDTIGLVSAEMSDPFFPEFADGVERAASAAGRTMFLASSGSDPERQTKALASFVGHGVDGVIVFPAAGSMPALIDFAKNEIPIVAVNVEADTHRLSSVSAEIRSGAQSAVDHLLGRGRRRIAFLMERTARHRGEPARRELGYRDALLSAGIAIDENLIFEVDNNLEGGRVGSARALEATPKVDAIFAYNDLIAIGALQHLLSAGISVPEEVAIVGFDDVMMCSALSPALSSVRIDGDQLGRVAVDMLQELIEHRPAPSRRLPVELVVRDSS